MHMLKKIMQGYDLVPNIKGIVAVYGKGTL